MIIRRQTRPNRPIDLAGYRSDRPRYRHTRARVLRLLNRYVTIDLLSDRLSDLPAQFINPQPRHWESIDSKGINRSQIVGIHPETFLQVIAGASEIEAPIRAYSQESRSYLERLHPEMAQFMGGSIAADGSITLGLWEKEERQHAPIFTKIYQQLTETKLTIKPNLVQGYIPTNNPWADVQQHVLARITTEWGAVSVYLWLMAHSTGELQQAIAQPLQDEINHLAKFWGFSRWAFADSFLHQFQGSTRHILALLRHHKSDRTYGNDLLGRTHRLHNIVLAVELSFTLLQVMVRLRLWNRELSHSYLKHLFGQPLTSDRTPVQVI